MYIDKEVNSLCWKDLLIRNTSYFTSFYCHYLAGSNYHASPCSEYCCQFYQSRARHSLESFDFRNPWKSHPLTRFGWETLLLRSFDYWFQIWNQECYFQAIFKQLWDRWKGYFVWPRKRRQQLEESYIEPTVIIISSLGFTTVSILYALWTNFYLGLIFILFYSFPVLCSAIGSKRLDSLSEKRSTVNQSYLASLTNFIGGSQQISPLSGARLLFCSLPKAITNQSRGRNQLWKTTHFKQSLDQ